MVLFHDFYFSVELLIFLIYCFFDFTGFLCFLIAELLKTAILDSLSGISHVSVFGVSYWKITFSFQKLHFFHFKNYTFFGVTFP